ncbi:hypothetical protein JCGZ_11490 [Jatropha curcas]|uniref:BHLH domain-containing protein n=1 Tax=Jatropha curcas TaxID=180498 RepID=A0A067KH05_JATCU|nr:hypothetical protein JCGZ_11490 [Jatropha curcas]
MKKSSRDSLKLDRKTVEKNRRIHMKALCFKLASVIPSQHFKHHKDMLSQQDQLDHAAAYIKNLKERIEKLEKKKERTLGSLSEANNNNAMNEMMMSLTLPMFELRDLGNSIEVVLISGSKRNFMLHEVITILEEEGAEVVSASYTTVGDKVFHTIHAQVKISRVGVETTRVCQRLQELIYWS